jgi:hypothetical protein
MSTQMVDMPDYQFTTALLYSGVSALPIPRSGFASLYGLSITIPNIKAEMSELNKEKERDYRMLFRQNVADWAEPPRYGITDSLEVFGKTRAS